MTEEANESTTEEPTGAVDQHSHRFGTPMNPALNIVITVILFVFLLLIWVVVGLLIWFPLLFRTAIAFSVVLLHNTLVGGELRHASRALDQAKTFWWDGLQHLRHSVFSPPTGSLQGVPAPTNLVRLVFEMLWAAGVWFVVLKVTRLADPIAWVAVLTDHLKLWSQAWSAFMTHV